MPSVGHTATPLLARGFSALIDRERAEDEPPQAAERESESVEWLHSRHGSRRCLGPRHLPCSAEGADADHRGQNLPGRFGQQQELALRQGPHRRRRAWLGRVVHAGRPRRLDRRPHRGHGSLPGRSEPVRHQALRARHAARLRRASAGDGVLLRVEWDRAGALGHRRQGHRSAGLQPARRTVPRPDPRLRQRLGASRHHPGRLRPPGRRDRRPWLQRAQVRPLPRPLAAACRLARGGPRRGLRARGARGSRSRGRHPGRSASASGAQGGDPYRHAPRSIARLLVRGAGRRREPRRPGRGAGGGARPDRHR